MKNSVILTALCFSILYTQNSRTIHVPICTKEMVKGANVGLRPCRRTGVRLELEERDGKVVVHDYGHCGMGITLSWGSAYEAVALMEARASEIHSPIAVIGAGIIGLTTAYVLLEKGYTVIIYSRDEPSTTTSMVAGGLWSIGSKPPQDAELFERMQRKSYLTFASLADSPSPLLRGVERYPIFAIDADPGLKPVIAGLLREPREVDCAVLGGSFCGGLEYETLKIDVPVYLSDLYRTVIDLGATIKLTELKSGDIACLDHRIIFNCAGLGAKELFDDDAVYPRRGQLAYLKHQPDIDYMLYTHVLGSTLPFYVIPQSDRIIIGGTNEPDNDSVVIDDTVTDQILENCRMFFSGT